MPPASRRRTWLLTRRHRRRRRRKLPRTPIRPLMSCRPDRERGRGAMAEPADVPSEIVTALRSVCAALPETYEEAAWTGRRWCVRRRTFAHVLAIEEGSPRAHALAAGSDGPVVVVVFRSAGEELDVLAAA